MKVFLKGCVTLIALGWIQAYAQVTFPHDTRSDSVNINHYTIRLDVTDFAGHTIAGNTDVYFKPLVNGIQFLDLDLIGLGVDSIKSAGGSLLTSSSLALGFRVNLGTTYNTGDSTHITVYYHGTPATDPTFGGFYFNNTYAFSIGVSLDDIPHNYGKTWFPCFDNFTTRSTYDFYITTQPQHDAACGGTYQGTFINPDLSETHYWKLRQYIPSYLASAGVANFVFVKDSILNSANTYIPIWLAALPSDTQNVKNSFIHLDEAFHIYEAKYGPFRWDRVGYMMESMNSGAMEHAMNIAFPAAAANGGLAWETVMAHELSHHWWGDLITCRTAEDMWINEGSAVYSEYLFKEFLYGRASYDADVRSNWKDLIRTCHIDDGGYWPLSGMPQNHTYGYTTYSKGGLILHTLRSYLGDSLYFTGVQQLLEDNKFSDVDAIEYRDDLGAITGYNLTNFFADWIFQGGWPHAAIDSVQSTPSGPGYTVTVYLRQKLAGRSQYSHQVPLLITLKDNNWNTYEQVIFADGSANTVTLNVPFAPTVAFLNRDEKIIHAVTSAFATIKNTGTVTMAQGNMNLQVQTITDSAYVVVEHHWVAPDPIIDWTYACTISPQRYWRVEGIFPAGFTTNATIVYNGRTTGSNAYLDNLLITGVEDSIVLLYRLDRTTDWTEFPTYTKVMGNTTDKSGNITITNLQKGEYALGYKNGTIGIEEQNSSRVRVFPNPTEGWITIEGTETIDQLTITNLQGQIVLQKMVNGTTTQVDTTGWAKGTYVISGFIKSKRSFSKKIVVK